MPPAVPPHRSIPIRAPVSRDIHIASGQRFEDGTITLSKDEREMAHATHRDVHPHEAERLYALGKKEMLKRKAAGTYGQDG